MQRPRYGMVLDDFDDSIWDAIVEIYAKAVNSPTAARCLSEYGADDKSAYVRECFGRGNAAEYRFGSILTEHSKLFIFKSGYDLQMRRVIKFLFDPNLAAAREEGHQEQVEALKAEFNTRVEEFLLSKGLAVLLR